MDYPNAKVLFQNAPIAMITDVDSLPIETADDAVSFELKPLAEFTIFNKLPIELRLRIWAFAAPGPATIAQRSSDVPDRPYYFVRSGGVPVLLHVCRESRMEYLEPGVGKDNETINVSRRQHSHPVYKLYFRNDNPNSAGAYMSLEIDTFWPMAYASDIDPWYDATASSNTMTRHYRGACEEVAHDLKHIAVNFPPTSTAMLVSSDRSLNSRR